VAGSCEYCNEPSVSGATELVSWKTPAFIAYISFRIYSLGRTREFYASKFTYSKLTSYRKTFIQPPMNISRFATVLIYSLLS
jgi:hypothetical protein